MGTGQRPSRDVSFSQSDFETGLVYEAFVRHNFDFPHEVFFFQFHSKANGEDREKGPGKET